MNTNARSLGWLGTGRMGAAMAGRLIDAGERVSVWNRTASKTAPLVARGAQAVARITDLGGCDIVFVMVATPGDLEEVVCGEHGLLSGERRPGTIVDCSTVSAAASAEGAGGRGRRRSRLPGRPGQRQPACRGRRRGLHRRVRPGRGVR